MDENGDGLQISKNIFSFLGISADCRKNREKFTTFINNPPLLNQPKIP
jgi:hypothetical protein